MAKLSPKLCLALYLMLLLPKIIKVFKNKNDKLFSFLNRNQRYSSNRDLRELEELDLK